MAKRIFLVLMTLLVIALTTPASAYCYVCDYFDSLYRCAETSGTGTNYCEEEIICSGSSCSSSCASTGTYCSGGGTGGNCAVLEDGTTICEENKGVRTTNGDVWAPSPSTDGTICAA